jgi:hypothetical protein
METGRNKCLTAVCLPNEYKISCCTFENQLFILREKQTRYEASL